MSLGCAGPGGARQPLAGPARLRERWLCVQNRQKSSEHVITVVPFTPPSPGLHQGLEWVCQLPPGNDEGGWATPGLTPGSQVLRGSHGERQ